jgi:hypothetical protein
MAPIKTYDCAFLSYLWPECYMERGVIYQKMRDYRRACVELAQAVRIEKKNFQVRLKVSYTKPNSLLGYF